MKNSTHPLRLVDSNNYRTKDTFPRMAATSFIHIYNFYLGLLGLALMAYSAYLIHMHSSPFSKLLMGIASFMVLTSLSGLVLPYAINSSKIAAVVWWTMNGLLGLFCLGLFVTSFFPAFFKTAVRMDAGAHKRENAGIFFLKQGNALTVFTILGAALSAAASSALGWLYYDWKNNPQAVTKSRPAGTDGGNLQAYRANNVHNTRDVERNDRRDAVELPPNQTTRTY